MNTLNKGLLYIVFFILFATRFIYTCNGENKLIKVTFVYNAYDWFIDYNLRDTYDTPSIFLNNPRSDLKFFDIEEETFLFEIEQVLDKSEPDSADYLLSSFNTDFVLFFQYSSGRTDTISCSTDHDCSVIVNNCFYKNPVFIDLILYYASIANEDWNRIREDCFWSGNYKFHSKPRYITDKGNYLPYENYGVFEGTKAELLAKSIAIENWQGVKKILLKDRSLVNFKDPDYGSHFISCCVYHQQNTMLKLLLESGAEVNIHDEATGLTPLSIACMSSYYNECGKLLLEYGADVNQKTFSGNDGFVYTHNNTPLLIAVENRNFQMVGWLIDKKANLSEENQMGYNVMDIALNYGYFDMAYYLISHGAYVRPKTIDDIPAYIMKYPYDKIPSFQKRFALLIENLLQWG